MFKLEQQIPCWPWILSIHTFPFLSHLANSSILCNCGLLSTYGKTWWQRNHWHYCRRHHHRHQCCSKHYTSNQSISNFFKVNNKPHYLIVFIVKLFEHVCKNVTKSGMFSEHMGNLMRFWWMWPLPMVSHRTSVLPTALIHEVCDEVLYFTFMSSA